LAAGSGFVAGAAAGAVFGTAAAGVGAGVGAVVAVGVEAGALDEVVSDVEVGVVGTEEFVGEEDDEVELVAAEFGEASSAQEEADTNNVAATPRPRITRIDAPIRRCVTQSAANGSQRVERQVLLKRCWYCCDVSTPKLASGPAVEECAVEHRTGTRTVSPDSVELPRFARPPKSVVHRQLAVYFGPFPWNLSSMAE
jgi:hypothetical protein